MVKVPLTKEQVLLVEEVAKNRYYSNRKANNPTKRLNTSDIPWYSDYIGAAGELAVALYLNVPWEGKYFEQQVFRQVKGTFNDVQGYEVRSTHHQNGRLAFRDKDIIEKPNTKFILCRVPTRNVVEIIGWYTPAETKDSFYVEGNYGLPAYFIPNDLLKDIAVL